MRAVLVNTEGAWIEMLSRMHVSSWISFDTETTCLDPLYHDFKIVGFCLAVDGLTGYYVPINHREPEQGTLFDMETLAPKEPLVQLPEEMVIEGLKPLIETREIIGHGLKFDYQVAKRYGIKLNHIVYDTHAASHILDERGYHNLKDITEKYLGYRPPGFEEIAGKSKKKDRRAPSNFDLVPLHKATVYGAHDAVGPVRLRELFRPHFLRSKKFFDLLQMEVKLIPEVAEMEGVGTNLDTDHLVKMHHELTEKANDQRAIIRKVARDDQLNPASGPQMVDLIYNKMNIKYPGKRKSDAGNKGLLERKTIEKLMVKIRTSNQATYGAKGVKPRWAREEVLELFKAQRALSRIDKMAGTYTVNLIDLVSDDGRLHTLFNQHGTVSGRFSSEQPNFQNLSRNTDPDDPVYGYDVRRAFRADPGWVYILADYAAMEMRICAALSGCPELTKIITGERRDAHGNPIDIHLYTACAAFHLDYDEAALIIKDKNHPRYMEIKEKRQKAKPVNFGIIYGMTEFGLAAELGEPVQFARSIIQGYMRAYPGVAQWMKNTETYLRANLYTETDMGRRRRISQAEVRYRDAFESAYKACLNHQIQGTGADIVKVSLWKISQELKAHGLRSRVAGQIHDEIIVHAPESEYEWVAKMMVEKMLFNLRGIWLPAEAEVKRTWSKMEEPLWKYAA